MKSSDLDFLDMEGVTSSNLVASTTTLPTQNIDLQAEDRANSVLCYPHSFAFVSPWLHRECGTKWVQAAIAGLKRLGPLNESASFNGAATNLAHDIGLASKKLSQEFVKAQPVEKRVGYKRLRQPALRPRSLLHNHWKLAGSFLLPREGMESRAHPLSKQNPCTSNRSGERQSFLEGDTRGQVFN